MNTTTLLSNPETEIKPGAIFVDRNDGELFLLAIVGGNQYTAVSLTTGTHWNNIRDNVNEATLDLELVCNAAEITIKPL